ncbi:MAG: glycosyltransferase family 4 protein [Planctomycetes bacterium]|nr:glycosyltransferase family 4 protein [Planctomycetota bacterium]
MSSTPHILLLNEFYHPDICASAVVAADHMEKIAALRPDWRITVLTGNRAWDDPTRIYTTEESVNGVRILRVERPAVRRDSLLSRGLGFAAFHRNVLRAARNLNRVDLVIGTTAPPQGGMLAAKIAKIHRCPFIYKVLDLYPDLVATLGKLNANSFVYRRWLQWDTRAMQDAAAVVTISTPITQRIANTRGIDPTKLHTIHDGYDPARLSFTGPNTFAAETNPHKKFLVQYAGNMGLSHPMDTILAAAKQLQGDPTILFQFIGDGPHRAAMARDLPANSMLINYQPAEKLGQVLDAADVCLISQHDAMFDQAMPYKVYACLAAGKPVVFIGSNKSEIAKWVKSHSVGLVVRHGDSADLIHAIQSIRNDLQARNPQSGRTFFDQSLTSVGAAEAWLLLIDCHLGRKG